MAKIQVFVVYAGGVNTNTVIYTDKNYSDVENIEASLENVLQTDDYGVDDAWVEGVKVSKINWKEVLTAGGGRIDPERLALVFEDDEEFFVKLEFLQRAGYDVEDVDLDEVIVYDASKDRKVEGNYNSEFPDGLLDQWSEEFYPDLVRALEKANGDSYFDWARLFSDNEVNGDFNSEWIDDYFVYMYR